MGDLTGNTISNEGISRFGITSNGMTSAPKFVTNGSNFHLQSNSPCIGGGVSSLGIIADYDGVVRGAANDIGAFEYVA